MTTATASLGISPDAVEAEVAAATEQWVEANLPADWLEAVRAGNTDVIEKILADTDRARAWYVQLGDAGLAIPTWPVDQGGLGLSAEGGGAVNEVLRRYRAGRPSADFVGLTLAGATILTWGNPEQKDFFLPPLARAQHFWCQLFSEPGAGSDLASLSTRAERQADGNWLVNGQKVWSSYAHLADFGLLMARTDPTLPKHRGITYFLLDMRTPGVDVRPLKQMTGNAEFNEVFFTDVVVPDSARIGDLNQGWSVAISTLMEERNGLTGAPAVGPGQADELARRARANGGWDDPVLRDRIMSALVTERVLQMTTVRSYVDAGRGAPGAEGSIRKLALAGLHEELGCLATDLEAYGAIAWPAGAQPPAAASEFLAMKTMSIAGGTPEILRNIIGERMLGLPKDPDPDKGRPFNERSRG